ncbi:MAG: RNA methyltransferase [Deltaproteobacteria bacterium]|nr:MAG: RNA methyltransferase [Deltaproteobacteria bacterium]
MSGNRQGWRCFATTAPGLEPFLAEELRALGVAGVKPGASGVAFRGDRETLMRVTMSARTAHRVLWTLGDVDASSRDALYQGVRAIARWQGLIPPTKTLAVFASVRDAPAFRDTRMAGLTVKDAIVDAVRDAVGARPSVSVDDPDVVVRLAVKGNRGVLSLDGAGRTSLHARGYRTEAGEAPLRETVAAAMILASGWDARTPLVDPMCGSGTLLIEAAYIAKRVAPGLLRDAHGFARWTGHRQDLLLRITTELKKEHTRRCPPLLGRDVDPALLDVAWDNAERAGVSSALRLERGDVRALVNPFPDAPTGVVVANPPYGQRLADDRAARELVAALGGRLREQFPGWVGCFILPRGGLARALDLPIEHRWPTKNGALDVEIVKVRVPRA